MSFGEFFHETDQIFHLMPIYYLNLKRFMLTCNYFQPTELISKLYQHLQIQNHDQNHEDYYCLFQK